MHHFDDTTYNLPLLDEHIVKHVVTKLQIQSLYANGSLDESV